MATCYWPLQVVHNFKLYPSPLSPFISTQQHEICGSARVKDSPDLTSEGHPDFSTWVDQTIKRQVSFQEPSPLSSTKYLSQDVKATATKALVLQHTGAPVSEFSHVSHPKAGYLRSTGPESREWVQEGRCLPSLLSPEWLLRDPSCKIETMAACTGYLGLTLCSPNGFYRVKIQD